MISGLLQNLLIVFGTGAGCSLLVLCVSVCLRRAQRRARLGLARRNRALLRSGLVQSSINSEAALADVQSGDLAAHDVVALLNDAALAERRELEPFIVAKAPRLLPTALEILLRWERRLTVLLAIFALASVPLMVACARGSTLAAEDGQFAAVFAFFTVANADPSSLSTALLAGTWFAVVALGVVLLLLALVQHVRTFRDAAVTARHYTCCVFGIAKSATIDDVVGAVSLCGPVVSVTMPLDTTLDAHCHTAFVTFLNASDAQLCVDQQDELRVRGCKVRGAQMASVESFELLSANFHVGRLRRWFAVLVIVFGFQLTALVPLGLKVLAILCAGMLDDALHLFDNDTIDEVVRVAIDLAFGLALHLAHKLIGKFLRVWLIPQMSLLTSSSFVLIEIICLTSMRTGSLAAIVSSTTFQCLGLTNCTPDALGSRRWFESSTRTVASAIVGELLGNIVLAPLWRLVRKRVFCCDVGEATLDISHRIASISTTFLYAMQFGGPAPIVIVLACVCLAVQFANDSMQKLAFAKDVLQSARGVDHAMVGSALSQMGAYLVFSNLLVVHAFSEWLRPELPAYAALQVPFLVVSICVFFIFWLARVVLSSGARCSRPLPPPQPITAHAVIDSFAFPGALRHKAEAMAAANGGTVRFDKHRTLFWARAADADDDD